MYYFFLIDCRFWTGGLHFRHHAFGVIIWWIAKFGYRYNELSWLLQMTSCWEKWKINNPFSKCSSWSSLNLVSIFVLEWQGDRIDAMSFVSCKGTSELRINVVQVCMHLLGVGKPSPWNTCPRWPPQAAQVISVRVMNDELSTCLLMAPGMAVIWSVRVINKISFKGTDRRRMLATRNRS